MTPTEFDAMAHELTLSDAAMKELQILVTYRGREVPIHLSNTAIGPSRIGLDISINRPKAIVTVEKTSHE